MLISEDITPELLLYAYACGIFFMARDRNDPDLYWLDPQERGILPLDRFHVPRSLRKVVRKKIYDVRCNSAFEQVIRRCAASVPGRRETWINERIIRLCSKLHEIGYAHSIELWKNDKLVGGLYGISLGSAFFGESMFSCATDASKVALVHLVARLRLSGYSLLDIQFITQHLKSFGACVISRRDYRQNLAKAMETVCSFPISPSPEALWQELENVFKLDRSSI